MQGRLRIDPLCMMHVVHRCADANISRIATTTSGAEMTPTDLAARRETTVSPSRRNFMALFAGASFALAGAAISGCSSWNMAAEPAKPKPKTMINGRQGGSGGGNMRKDPGSMRN
jgi:hypothetical protein